jgi:hypothetical protein
VRADRDHDDGVGSIGCKVILCILMPALRKNPETLCMSVALHREIVDVKADKFSDSMCSPGYE